MPTFAENLQRIAGEPQKGARLVARTFYRELRVAGYTDRDIMAVADALLGCLTASLRQYRLKKEIPVERVEEAAER